MESHVLSSLKFDRIASNRVLALMQMFFGPVGSMHHTLCIGSQIVDNFDYTCRIM